MNNLLSLSFLLCLQFPAATLAADKNCMNSGDPVVVENVRKQRQVFNRAIADKDLPAIEGLLDNEVILVTGTDSDLYSGAEAQLAIWGKDFSNAKRAVYVRTPSCVRVSSVAPVALEIGFWRGERPATPEDFAAGSYAAKWRRVNGHWLLESEIFATEACGGGFCPDS